MRRFGVRLRSALGNFYRANTSRVLLVLGTFVLLEVPDFSMSADGVVPQIAIENGIDRLTFNGLFDSDTVDVSNSRAPGFSWYRANFFGKDSPVIKGDVDFDHGGVALSGAQLLSAMPSRLDGWNGIAFGGGGYFEAQLKFSTNLLIDSRPNGWPAFWLFPIEHFADLPEDVWGGQAERYKHFGEVDVFEYDVASRLLPNAYGAAVHDWYGKFRETCPKQVFCDVNTSSAGGSRFPGAVIVVPPWVDFGKFHTYGVLWIPASDGENGWIQFFFDRSPVTKKISFAKYEVQKPPPGLADWTFGIIDKQHLVPIIQSPVGTAMVVRYVRIWQRSNKYNVSRH